METTPRIAYVIAMLIFVFTTLGGLGARPWLIPSGFPLQVLMIKYVPLSWTLPALTLLPKYVPHSATVIHAVVAIIGAWSALRWWYYYFLSGGAMGDWLNALTMNALPSGAFPPCPGSGGCYTQIYGDLFSYEAFSTHGFCTYDGMSVTLTSFLHIAIDGARWLPRSHYYLYLAGGLIAPEAVYSLFLIQLASTPTPLREGFISFFRLYILLLPAVILPMLMAVNTRLFIKGHGAESLGEHSTANASAVRAYVLITVPAFSHLAWMLPDYAEETPERAKNRVAVWLKKGWLWNVYLSHVGAAHLGFLAFRELDLEEDNERWIAIESDKPKAA